MDEGARELEAPLHAAGELPGPTATDVPQVEQLEYFARPLSTAEEQHPEQGCDEVDVLADRQVRRG